MNILPQENLNIASLSHALLEGQTLVYPTETCYGLGCDATNQEAVDQIFYIKQRRKDKPVLVIAHDLSVMLDHIIESPVLFELAEKYWPGPLTVVVRARPDSPLAKGVIAEDGTVAFRITEHPIAAALCEALDGPIVSTSANIAAQASPYDIADVLDMFQGESLQPDSIIDAGILPDRSPSTVVRINMDGTIDVLREGNIRI